MEAKKNGVYPVFLAFLCMGFGDVVGPMVSDYLILWRNC